MDIICRKRKCKYNKGFCCTAREIDVNRGIVCSTFILNEQNKDIPDTSINIFEDEPPKYSSHRETKRGCIKCHANCLFNTDCICDANGITINDIKNKPFCVTYLKK